jgi:O-methyltransferase
MNSMKKNKKKISLYIIRSVYNFFLNFKTPIKKILNLFNLRLVKIYSFPIEANKKIIKFINISSKFSMTGNERMYLLSQAILNAKEKRLDGDFVECGVWRGGNILLYKLLNDFYSLNKTIFAYDTFEGMTEPEGIDIDHQGNSAKKRLLANNKSENLNNIHCFSTIDSVKKNISECTNLKNINFIVGPVEKTLLKKKNLPKKISVLRLDTDWYSSTKIELKILYPRLVYGGVLIIDDYGAWQGSRKATDEYFLNKKKWLHVYDDTLRYLIKD